MELWVEDQLPPLERPNPIAERTVLDIPSNNRDTHVYRLSTQDEEEYFGGVIRGQPGPQTDFLSCSADICIYGGAAGGGKTFALLIEPLRHITNGEFGGVVFRRVSEQIRIEGGLWDASTKIYPLVHAKGRENTLDWSFPSGAKLTFDSLQHEKNVLDFQGSEICYLAFDELTHFTSRQFWYLLSRNRSTCGVRPYVRATLNPDPDSWVFELVGPWVDEDHPLYPTPDGQVLWFIREDDEIKWVPAGTKRAKSITFIKADIFDNKILLEKDPGYLANLEAQNKTDRERLLLGRWSAIQAAGALWKREWIERDRVKEAPALARVVIGLDPSASSGPDAAEAGIVGVGKSKADHLYTLSDKSGVYTPRQWATIAIQEFYRLRAACIVAEKNQGGEMVSTVIHQIDPDVPVKLVHAKKGKKVRADPVASVAEAGFDHHVGEFKALEGQLTRWEPANSLESPDRLDAKVYACLELGLPDLKALTAKPQTASLPAHLRNKHPGQSGAQPGFDDQQRIIPPPRPTR